MGTGGTIRDRLGIIVLGVLGRPGAANAPAPPTDRPFRPERGAPPWGGRRVRAQPRDTAGALRARWGRGCGRIVASCLAGALAGAVVWSGPDPASHPVAAAAQPIASWRLV